MPAAGGFGKANPDQGSPNDARIGRRGRTKKPPTPQRSGVGQPPSPTKSGHTKLADLVPLPIRPGDRAVEPAAGRPDHYDRTSESNLEDRDRARARSRPLRSKRSDTNPGGCASLIAGNGTARPHAPRLLDRRSGKANYKLRAATRKRLYLRTIIVCRILIGQLSRRVSSSRLRPFFVPGSQAWAMIVPRRSS
jgi:hypothetical protein